MTKPFDLFVIGAGSGGVRAARVASQAGARVGIAESYRVGGTCVIRGCVPKKLFIYASEHAKAKKVSTAYGWSDSSSEFNWPTLVSNKDQVIDRFNQGYIQNLEKSGVEIFHSHATIVNPGQVRLDALDQTVDAEKILIATGSSPSFPHLGGIEHAISSDDAFHLEALPQSILIVGGGYIAVEFAGIFNGVGVETTVCYRGEQILRGFDQSLRDHLADQMQANGIEIKLGQNPKKIEKKDGAFRVTFENGDQAEFGQVLYATGRRANTKGLGLENVGVECKQNGAVKVDHHYATNVPGIYALGDVTDRIQLTPVAIREGMAFVETYFKDNPTTVDYTNIPTAVFSQPEIGTIGLDEVQAKKLYGEIDIFQSSFIPLKMSMTEIEDRMMMKLIVAKSTDKVVGCHILGPGAAEMIQLAGVAIKMGATKADFDATVAVHPTAAEELVTMK